MSQTSRKFTARVVLTPRQEQAACSLAAGYTIEAASEHCKTTSRAVKKWLANIPAFKERIVELRSQATEVALSRLSRFAGAAAKEIVRTMLHSANEKVRLRAADLLLEKLLPLTELCNHEERLQALEQNQPKARPRRTAS